MKQNWKNILLIIWIITCFVMMFGFCNKGYSQELNQLIMRPPVKNQQGQEVQPGSRTEVYVFNGPQQIPMPYGGNQIHNSRYYGNRGARAHHLFVDPNWYFPGDLNRGRPYEK